jgi:mannitol/fructose-specific phosphotransferase system IIA component (Ntr-type)
MQPSSRTPEGDPNQCPVCGKDVYIEPTTPPGDAPCPHCGHLLWFTSHNSLETFEFVPREAVVSNLSAATKSDAIRLLVGRLLDAGRLPKDSIEGATSALIHREELGSTAIGGGVAVPHAKVSSVAHLVGAIGYAPQGIEWDSLDGAPVTRIFLILSSLDDPDAHFLKALERVSRHIRNKV